MDYDVVILGAGASGLICAMTAAGRGRRVAVLDHADAPGRKVAISGGGRCNFTNTRLSAEDYLSANPHFAKSALAGYATADALALFTDLGLAPVAEDLGKVFCAKGAKAAARALYDRAVAAGAAFFLGRRLNEVRAEGAGFAVSASGRTLTAGRLVLALGGPAWPRIGATDLGFRLARNFGLNLVPARPGLVPLRAPADLAGWCRDLAGLSLPVAIGLPGGRAAVVGDLLFTHLGLSGPAVLDASLLWQDGQSLVIDFLPGRDLGEVLAAAPRQEPAKALARVLPKRLAASLAASSGAAGPAGGLSKKDRLTLSGLVHGFAFTPSGTEGYARAEVAAGGVDTDQVSSRTMEAKAVPGLYLVGEVLDVTGRLGGFNLHWALASGLAAGRRV